MERLSRKLILVLQVSCVTMKGKPEAPLAPDPTSTLAIQPLFFFP